MLLFSSYYPPFVIVYTLALTLVLGLVMGSYFNCTAIRICKGESRVRGRSHCVLCGHTLGALDLIPVFSWLFLKGKCRYCGGKISSRYLWSEIITALAFLGVVCRFGLTLKTAEGILLTSILLLVSFCDLEATIIPDRFILIGIAVRAVFILLSDNVLSSALWSLVSGLSVALPVYIVVIIMEKILKREAMGGGDIKLFFVVGLYLTWQTNILNVLVACVVGIVFGLIAGKKGEAFPFGQSIALAAWITYLFGEQILNVYLGMF